MKNTAQWLQEVIQVLEIEDKFGKGQKLATALGVGQMTIMNQLKGKSEMQNDQATKVARALGVLPMTVISSVNYNECMKKNEKENAKIWKSIYERSLEEKKQNEKTELKYGTS